MACASLFCSCAGVFVIRVRSSFASSRTLESAFGRLNRRHVSKLLPFIARAPSLSQLLVLARSALRCSCCLAGRGGKHARCSGTLREVEFNEAAAAEDANAARAAGADGAQEVEVVEEADEGGAGEAGGDGGSEGDAGEV